jgi:hypothetical protein
MVHQKIAGNRSGPEFFSGSGSDLRPIAHDEKRLKSWHPRSATGRDGGRGSAC